jgi:type IV secretion system protein VirB10
MADDKQIPEAQFPPQSPSSIPSVKDRRVLPEGVVPKQAQGYVVAGLAVLILLAVMFSKNHAKPASKEVPSSPQAASTEMNQRKIQELEQDLSADQRQSQQQMQAQRGGAAAPTAGAASSPANAAPAAASQLAPAATASPEALRDPIADAEKALAFKARFASNLVSADDGAVRPSAANSAEATSLPSGLTARPKELPEQASASPSAASEAKRAPEVSVNSAHGKPYVVFEGTTIDTVLSNRLDGEYAGPVKAMVTNAIYSQDRQHVLIPEGTFILGDVQKVSGFGQKRLAIAFHRLLMPDGYSVDLDRFHGLDQIGDTGLKDKIDNHYMQIFGASIALGVIAGAAESTNAIAGLTESGSEAYRAGIASSLSQSSANVLDRFINIPPSITIREGHRIKVYITQDLLLPAYENHTVPGDI